MGKVNMCISARDLISFNQDTCVVVNEKRERVTDYPFSFKFDNTIVVKVTERTINDGFTYRTDSKYGEIKIPKVVKVRDHNFYCVVNCIVGTTLIKLIVEVFPSQNYEAIETGEELASCDVLGFEVEFKGVTPFEGHHLQLHHVTDRFYDVEVAENDAIAALEVDSTSNDDDFIVYLSIELETTSKRNDPRMMAIHSEGTVYFIGGKELDGSISFPLTVEGVYRARVVLSELQVELLSDDVEYKLIYMSNIPFNCQGGRLYFSPCSVSLVNWMFPS